MSDREVAEGLRSQGKDENITYTVDTANQGGSPSGVTVTAWKESDWSNVSDTVLTGSASVNGDVITMPELGGLTLGEIYRVEYAFTSGGNDLEGYFRVRCER